MYVIKNFKIVFFSVLRILIPESFNELRVKIWCS